MLRLPQHRNRVGLGELPPRADPFKELSTCSKLKGEIILGSRFEPLVELDLGNA